MVVVVVGMGRKDKKWIRFFSALVVACACAAKLEVAGSIPKGVVFGQDELWLLVSVRTFLKPTYGPIICTQIDGIMWDAANRFRVVLLDK